MPLQARGTPGRNGLAVIVDVEEYKTALGAEALDSRLRHAIDFTAALANGSADGNIDRVISLDTSATTTPTDLNVRSLTSQLDGSTITMVNFTGAIFVNDDATNNLHIGGDTSAVAIFGAAADYIIVHPGGIFVWYSPAGVTPGAGSTDVLQVAASAGTVPYRVLLFGRST